MFLILSCSVVFLYFLLSHCLALSLIVSFGINFGIFAATIMHWQQNKTNLLNKSIHIKRLPGSNVVVMGIVDWGGAISSSEIISIFQLQYTFTLFHFT